MGSSLALTKFNYGLLSEKVSGGASMQGALKQCENAIIELTGSVRKRGGFKFLRELDNSGLLFQFIYNNDEYFLIIVSNDGIKIYDPKTNAITWSVQDTLDPITISMYQIQDTVYVFSPKFFPKKLIRKDKAGTSWTYNNVDFIEPPWLPENDTDYTITCNIDTTDGTTAKDTPAILTTTIPAGNMGSYFLAGQWVRLNTIKNTEQHWSWFEITSIDGNKLNAKYKGGTTTQNYASKIWRPSAFRNGRYPTCGCIHEGRLCYCMNRYVFLSKSDAYDNFSLTNAKGIVAASNAMTVTINMKQANDIVWCASDRNLMIGTNNEEYAIKADDYGTTLTPTTIKAQQQSTVGSVFYPVTLTDSGIIAIKKFGKKAIFYAYSADSYRYGYKDLNLYNEDITTVGINDVAYTSDPTPVLWLSLVDGTLCGATLSISDDVIAFHKHTTQGKILSITALPNANNNDMDLYAIIRRQNGVFLEVMSNGVNVETKSTENLFYSDSSLSFSSDVAKTHWSGFAHLKGQTVKVLADGAVQPEVVVSETGEIDIQYPAKKIVVGLGYDMYIQPTEISVQEIVLENKTKNISSVSARLYKSVGCWIGSENDKLMEIPWRNTNDRMNVALPLYTDLKKMLLTGGWRTDGAIIFGHKDPLPFWLLAIYFEANFGK